jgi:hypothetical protein
VTALAAKLTPARLATALRLRDDFAFWAASCYTIQAKPPGLALLKLVMNRAQRRVYDAEQESQARTGRGRVYVLKGRQGGITTYEQARSLHAIWGTRGAHCMTVSHTDDHVDKLFEITRRALRAFPPALLPEQGTRGSHEVSFPRRDSRLWIETAGKEGRSLVGLTLLRVHASEFALWQNPEATLAKLGPSIEPRGTSVVLETTAGLYDSEAHEFWRRSRKGETGYTALFIPWWDCDLQGYVDPVADPASIRDTLEPDERDLMERHGLTVEHIAWRRRQIGVYGKADFQQQYAEDQETCWLAGGQKFFDIETLRWLQERALQPVRVDEDGVQHFTKFGPAAALWPTGERPATPLLMFRNIQGYVEPKPERAIIGVDTAEGGAREDDRSRDRSVFRVRSFPSWRLLAGYASRGITPRDLARLLAKTGHAFGVALLVVERNLHGVTVLRHLVDDERYPRELIYHRTPADTAIGPRDQSDRMGWMTTETSKPLLLDAARALFNAAREGTAGLPDREVVADAFAVSRDETGRVDLNGRDTLVADMLAWMGRSYPVGQSRTYRMAI